MLTRLKVSGFKNLVDVDVRFGPFTCIAGANGVGKSNLFDAIKFLSMLADHQFMKAAQSVRDEGGRSADVRSLFHRTGAQTVAEMSFEAEMIVPQTGRDDLGQEAKAGITFLRYGVTLIYEAGEASQLAGSLKLVNEELEYITKSAAKDHLGFPHTVVWRDSVLHGRRASPFISTEKQNGELIIELHQDGGGGRVRKHLASELPRTVLSSASAAENPTALLARREMQSWRLLQLEPSALRKPDDFTAPPKLGMDGSHLPSTLYYLARANESHKQNGNRDDAAASKVYSNIANRLAELINDVYEVGIDRDERREILTLQVTGQDGTSHPAQALSDGTLRFLALAVLDLDPEAQGVLCLEEPENGIHPERIPAMLRLLQDIATDVNEPVGYDNPLRQVIINTHSPAVVLQVPEDSLLVAELKEMARGDKLFKRVQFSCLPGTWRDRETDVVSVVSKGKLLAYLNPVEPTSEQEDTVNGQGNHKSDVLELKVKRVMDRLDLQPLLPFNGELR